MAVVRDTPQTQDRERLKKIVADGLGPDYALEDVVGLSDIGMTEFPVNPTGKVPKIVLKEAVLRLRNMRCV